MGTWLYHYDPLHLASPDYNYTGWSSRTTNTVNQSHQSAWSDWDDWTGEDLIVLFVERVLVRAGQKKMTILTVLGFSFPISTGLTGLSQLTGTGPAGLAEPSLYHRHGRTHPHRKSYYCLLQLVCSYWGSSGGLGTCIVRSDLWEIFLTLIFMKTGAVYPVVWSARSICKVVMKVIWARLLNTECGRENRTGFQREYPGDGGGKILLQESSCRSQDQGLGLSLGNKYCQRVRIISLNWMTMRREMTGLETELEWR